MSFSHPWASCLRYVSASSVLVRRLAEWNKRSFNHVLVDGMIVHGYIGYILLFHVPHPLFYAVFVESKSI